MTKKKILIATGGTGGHIFPALSLAKNLIKKNYDIILTTDKRGLKYLSDINDINFKKITSSPLVKKNIFRLIYSALLICYSTVKSLFLLSLNRPHIIIGMGGYSSFPVCIAATILRIKHENSTMRCYSKTGHWITFYQIQYGYGNNARFGSSPAR